MAFCQSASSANVTTVVSMSSNEQGKIMGLNSSIVSAAAAIPPLLAGYFDAINIHLPVIIASILVGSSSILFYFKYKRNSPIA
jgi:MFS family permease